MSSQTSQRVWAATSRHAEIDDVSDLVRLPSTKLAIKKR